jgi:predicted nucleic acid-binding protein
LAERLARDEFVLSAVKVVVAAELYRRKTGRRPESLDALVPEFLPSVPVDPFDHGAALKYDAERGILWTVGPNRDFNGEMQPGKKSYGRNRIYVVNLDGSKVK